MDWILEHLNLVLAVAGAFAYWLKQRSDSKQEKEVTKEMVDAPPPPSMADADSADRARKIREEILRKITERRGGAPAPQARTQYEEPARNAEPPPLRPVMHRREMEVVPPVLPRGETDEAVLARQERLAQQMRELDGQRAVAKKRAAAFAEETRVAEGISERAASSVRADLRDPRKVRHAVLLREILGPPVALR